MLEPFVTKSLRTDLHFWNSGSHKVIESILLTAEGRGCH